MRMTHFSVALQERPCLFLIPNLAFHPYLLPACVHAAVDWKDLGKHLLLEVSPQALYKI